MVLKNIQTELVIFQIFAYQQSFFKMETTDIFSNILFNLFEIKKKKKIIIIYKQQNFIIKKLVKLFKYFFRPNPKMPAIYNVGKSIPLKEKSTRSPAGNIGTIGTQNKSERCSKGRHPFRASWCPSAQYLS